MNALLDTRRPRLLLTLFCLLLWAPGFWTLPPGDRDESRFVQATKQMIETGDYVRIMNGTEARNRKPIGIHWLQAPFALAARAAGVATENPVWPYRIPSALGGWLAVLACFSVGQRLVGRRAALLGAAGLAAAILLVVEVHIAKTDAALLGATTVAMAVLGRAYLDPGGLPRRGAALFWLAMGVGVMLKGPITPMVVVLAVLSLLAVDRRWAWLRCLHARWGVPLMLAVVLPWFIAIGMATGGRFFSEAVGGDLGRKLTSGDDAHGAPPGFHLVLLPFLLFPLTAAWPGGMVAAWWARREPGVRFLLAWIIPSWIVFEATPTKLPHYPLPLYPAMALLVALGLERGASPAWCRRLGVALAAIPAVVLTVGSLVAPFFLRMPADAALLAGIPGAVGAAVAGWFALRALRPGGAVRALAASFFLYAGVVGWTLPHLSPLWIAPRVVAAVPGLKDGARLGAVGFAEPSLMMLAGTGTQWKLAEEGAEALANHQVDVLLVGDRDVAAVRAALAKNGITPRVLAEIPGFNYSRGRFVTLTALALP